MDNKIPNSERHNNTLTLLKNRNKISQKVKRKKPIIKKINVMKLKKKNKRLMKIKIYKNQFKKI